MNCSPHSLRAYRYLLALWIALGLCGFFGSVRAQDAAPISNATPAELAAIQNLLGALNRNVAARDVTALRFVGLTEEAAKYASLRLDTRISHLAVSGSGALVKQIYRVEGQSTPSAAPSVLTHGTHEFFLKRDGSHFTWANQHWQPPTDALAALTEAARAEWERVMPGQKTPSPNSILHLVAARQGGRWVALRRSRWEGALMDARNLAALAANQTIVAGNTLDPSWIGAQMTRIPDGAGTAHFLLQRSPAGWIGITAAWDENEKIPEALDKAAIQARRAMQGSAYTSASAHKNYAVALGQVGLWNEAYDELEKAEALEPGVAGAQLRAQVSRSRESDPETSAVTQLQNEARVGLDPNHPSYLVSALVQDYNAQPSILRALRLGLEYSRLGDDRRSSDWLDAAQELARTATMRNASTSDIQWIQVLSDHLQERRTLSRIKPPNVIRSPLFVLRCFPNELSAAKILASLEAAQHTVYADFTIPMSSTEVLAWRNQAEFRSYTSRFSAQGQSEFVAALTLTKLIASREGPVVLGEEINIFADPRMAPFHTVAHEYGHVAVRQLSRGRDVPVWFNEGIATSVEGGYDGYQQRIADARRARSLLTMDELLEWDVDGQRAFLAYSQANSIIDYIVATWGKAAVLSILRQIGNDVNPDDAFQNVLSISQYELWRRWAQSLEPQ